MCVCVCGAVVVLLWCCVLLDTDSLCGAVVVLLWCCVLLDTDSPHSLLPASPVPSTSKTSAT